jgi:hypothetical protein
MVGEIHKLKMIPYGPAGMELIPKGLRTMIDANASNVETIDETKTKDWNQSAVRL